MGWVVIHPCNTVAVRMNLAMASGTVGAGDLSAVAYVRHMVKSEGILSLYDGLPAGLMKQVFYSTSRFGLFEVMRDEAAKYRPTDIWSRLGVGVVSGGCAAVLSCPAEVTLVRMTNDASLPASNRRNYRGVLDAFRRILKEEGFKTFFSGSGAMQCDSPSSTHAIPTPCLTPPSSPPLAHLRPPPLPCRAVCEPRHACGRRAGRHIRRIQGRVSPEVRHRQPTH